MLLLLTILDDLSYKDVGGIVVLLIVAVWAIKSGIPQQLFTSTNSLLEKRTTERDDALRERDKAQTLNDELDKEITMLRREIIQRIAIYIQDQETIKDLNSQLRKLNG